MLSRANLSTSAFKTTYKTRLRLSTHGASAALHRLATHTPSLTTIAGNAIKRPLLSKSSLLAGYQPARRAWLSLWSSGNEKPIKQRVVEASQRHHGLGDRELLLLYLDKQDEAWRKQSSSARRADWWNHAECILLAAGALYVEYYFWPSNEARNEKARNEAGQLWNKNFVNQVQVYNKLMEIEERLDK
ncbi:hypothetical protein IMSHALPRED_004448 [Imshaugia aleurites]|uniref:Uncharacterized protein n=1 Tax=Imshaugia aleurites TaxID=172621 RepID=A0A8H3FA11_9LECA|nr:hypothetical protein IMSHALPRED_004448 [Imshaugia aleurites]